MATEKEKTEILKNPELLPLNSLYLSKKVVLRKPQCPIEKLRLNDVEKLELIDFSKYYTTKLEKLNAISPEWILKKRQYYNFQPYCYTYSLNDNTHETFIEKNVLFLGSIQHLVDCTYRYFWCYVLCESRVSRVLNSFLEKPVFNYDTKYMDSSCLKVYQIVCTAIYTIFGRMISPHESKTEFMSEDYVFENLFKCHYLNLKNVMVLIHLFNGTTVNDFVDRLIKFYFTKKNESRIQGELKEFLNQAVMELETVEANVCADYEGIIEVSPATKRKPGQFDPGWVEEMVSKILYVGSILSTLFSRNTSLIDSVTGSGLIEVIAPFYDKVIPELLESIPSEDETPENLLEIRKRLLEKIALAFSYFITLFNCFVVNLIDNIIKNNENPKNQQHYLDSYFGLISSILEHDEFLKDYNSIHKIDQQLQIIEDFCKDVELTRTRYVKDCLNNLTPKKKKQIESTKESASDDEEDDDSDENEEELLDPVPSTSTNNIVIPSEDELSGLINIVQDVCPDVGTGFIFQCLEKMMYDPVQVIEAIQSNSLPKVLENVPRDSVYIPPEKSRQPEVPILAYRGKKPQYRDANALLDDKSDMQDIKNFVIKTINDSYDPYDDDYDDAENDPVLNLDRTAEDFYEVRPGMSKFQEYEVVSDPSDSSDEITQDNERQPRDAFCENPEVIRARREAKRAQTYRRGGGGGGSGPSNRDVVGKPKGQGQDKNVQANRDKKNVHKSSKANHNRKGGAQWKRSKGMVPSIDPFYERIIFDLLESIKNEDDPPENVLEIRKKLVKKIAWGCFHYVTPIKCFIDNLIEYIINSSDNLKKQQLYIDVYCLLVLEYGKIIEACHSKDKLDQHLLIHKDSCKDKDFTTTRHYAKVFLYNLIQEKKEKVESTERTTSEADDDSEEDDDDDSDEDEEEILDPVPSTSSNDIVTPSDEELSDLINIVRRAYPLMDTCDILQCLKAMKYDPVQVITAIQSYSSSDVVDEDPKDSVCAPLEKPEQPKVRILDDESDDDEDSENFEIKISYGERYDYDYEEPDRDPLLYFDRVPGDFFEMNIHGFQEYQEISDEEDNEPQPNEGAFYENPDVVRIRRAQMYGDGDEEVEVEPTGRTI